MTPSAIALTDEGGDQEAIAVERVGISINRVMADPLLGIRNRWLPVIHLEQRQSQLKIPELGHRLHFFPFSANLENFNNPKTASTATMASTTRSSTKVNPQAVGLTGGGVLIVRIPTHNCHEPRQRLKESPLGVDKLPINPRPPSTSPSSPLPPPDPAICGNRPAPRGDRRCLSPSLHNRGLRLFRRLPGNAGAAG